MLHIVGTPIGNLKDLSIRQATAIMSADIILAENTSSAGILLQQIPLLFPDQERNPELRVMPFHKDNEFQKLSEVLELVDSDRNLVMISEAGMPLVADPGYALIKHLIKTNSPFEVIPGPTAWTTALVYSGFEVVGSVFLGFLPKKPQDKRKLLTKQLSSFNVAIFYESPFRIVETLEILEELHPTAQVVICRELTKKFEEIVRGTPSDLKTREYKGEITVVLQIAK